MEPPLALSLLVALFFITPLALPWGKVLLTVSLLIWFSLWGVAFYFLDAQKNTGSDSFL